MGAQSYSLEERLQAEFCPPLDSSLIAAFINDYCPHGQVDPSSQAEQSLRTILSELAAQAEKDENALSDRFSNLELGTNCSVTDDTSSSNELFSNDTQTTSPTTFSSNVSEASGGSLQPFSSPMGFLQTAFPDIPTHRLRSILSSMGDIEDLDMEEVVDQICSLEFVRELEQRGLDGLDGADQEDLTPWLPVESKKKPSPPAKKQPKKGMTFTFGDIRQKQHIRRATAPSTPGPSNGTPDTWTQVSSLATHLASLVPSLPESHFQSIFHSPEYSTPSAAIRASLSTIKNLEESIEIVQARSIFEILESSDDFVTLSPSDREQLMADTRLAVRATGGQPDAALDLVQCLRELDSDAVSGEVEWRLYHSPAPPPSHGLSQYAANAARRSMLTLTLPSGPPAVPPPPTRQRSAPVLPISPNAWKTVTPTRKAGPSSHHLAEFIPAYNPANVPTKKGRGRGGVNGPGKSAKNGALALVRNERRIHSLRAKELMQQRAEALKEAGRAWQNGNAKSRGGEVAFYYAEKARQLQERAFREQLVVAQGKVDASRQYSKNGNTIDLHGTTVPEAIHIVKRTLEEDCPSAAKPLRIITGRGNHSANRVGVLGPAVKAALIDEGWNVGMWDAGLVVRGRLASKA